MRRTWSDRWLHIVVAEGFAWATSAAAVALTTWATWPLAVSSMFGAAITLLIACVASPVLVLVIVGPAGLVVTVVCALADEVIAGQRGRRP